MTDAFETCLAFTLRAEGGYVDDPADPGGATNRGITLATLRQWSDNPNLGIAQVKDMTLRTAQAIYRSLYWNPLRADALAGGVDLMVFDMGVNAGIWRSARLLQRALGFTGQAVDGCVGPETLEAAAKCITRSAVGETAVVPTKAILKAAGVQIIRGHHVLALESSPEGWQAAPLLERC